MNTYSLFKFATAIPHSLYWIFLLLFPRSDAAYIMTVFIPTTRRCFLYKGFIAFLIIVCPLNGAAVVRGSRVVSRCYVHMTTVYAIYLYMPECF